MANKPYIYNTYNPIRKDEEIPTKYGLIRPEHALGRTYVTWRKKEHIFEKYGAFAISREEEQRMSEEFVKWILIMYYHKDNTQTVFRIKTQDIRLLPTYDNGADRQIIIPINLMEKKKYADWETINPQTWNWRHELT